jgi:small-conductance mechanosensitive channel/CRP-like cAMP-binding protein
MTFFARAVQMWPLAALLFGLLLLAVAIAAIVPVRRPKLRRVLLLLALSALVAGTEQALARLGYDLSAAWLGIAATLLLSFTVVNVVAILAFDLLLPRIGVQVAPIVYELLLASGWLFAAVVVLTTSGVDLTGVVAASTIAAAILTISLQNTLGNVVGGIAVQFDGSLRAGDWVALESGRHGRVREIRWRHTVVETRGGDAVVVPNSALLSSTLTLLGRRDGRAHPHRIEVPFLTDVGTPPDLVVRLVTEALRDAPIDNVAGEPAPDCVCVDLGAGAKGFTRFAARAWLDDLGPYDPTVSRVAERVHAAMRRASLPFGSPTVGVYGAGPGGDLDLREAAQLRTAARRLLDQVSLFAPLTGVEKDRLALELVHHPYSDGEVVTRQGATAFGLYLVGSGSVRVVQRVGDDDVELAVLEAPSLFGEMGLMTGEPRSASVTALGPTSCWRLDKPVFDRILRERPAIAEDLSELLAARRFAQERDTDPATRKARERTEQARILDRIRQFFGL